MFLVLTLYMQNILHYTAIQTGLAYLPLCSGVGIAAGSHQAHRSDRHATGDRHRRSDRRRRALLPLAHPSRARQLPLRPAPWPADLSLGLGAVFWRHHRRERRCASRPGGLAAALLNASQQLGGALGLAILSTQQPDELTPN